MYACVRCIEDNKVVVMVRTFRSLFVVSTSLMVESMVHLSDGIRSSSTQSFVGIPYLYACSHYIDDSKSDEPLLAHVAVDLRTQRRTGKRVSTHRHRIISLIEWTYMFIRASSHRAIPSVSLGSNRHR